MDLSFVILTWNSVSYVEKCISTIEKSLSPLPLQYEILILDNGSTDGTADLLRRLAADSAHVVPFFEATNTGTTRSRNRLFAAAKGRYICVMDSDVELHEGVIDTLIPFLERDASLGIVVPRIQYPSGAWQKSFDAFPTVTGKVNRFFRLREIEQSEGERMKSSDAPFPVDYAISAFWLFKRNLLDRIGGLDERIFYAPEDADFCLRVWQAGYRVLFVPSVCVTHHTQEISRGFKLNRAKLEHIKGLGHYFRKHGYLFRKPVFDVAANAPIKSLV
jgi:GT2 family glycosyltransferase